MLLDNCETVLQQLIQSLTETMSELINGNGKSFKMLLFEAKIWNIICILFTYIFKAKVAAK